MLPVRSLVKHITNYDNSRSLGSRFRAKRIAPLLQLIDLVFQEQGCVNIIDVGGTANYWNIVPRQYLDSHNVTVTIVNLPETKRPANFGPFIFHHGDGCNLLDFGDKSFDIAHSNSVIEHVGDWGRMIQFSGELRRLARRYFVQTPNYWFPVEPHCMTPFFHWLPRPIRVWLIRHFSLGYWSRASSVDEAVRAVDSARLLDINMFRELFGDSEVLTERLAFFIKSFVAIRK